MQLVTAWQSVSQIEAAYARDAPAILTNHLSKLYYPGMTDRTSLDYLSRLLGKRQGPPNDLRRDNANKVASGVGTRPAAPAVLRRLHPGDAPLTHGALPPAHVRSKRLHKG